MRNYADLYQLFKVFFETFNSEFLFLLELKTNNFEMQDFSSLGIGFVKFSLLLFGFNYAFENVLLENKSSCSIFQFTLCCTLFCTLKSLKSMLLCKEAILRFLHNNLFWYWFFSNSIIFFTFTLKKSVTLLNCLHKGQSTIKRLFMSLA